MAQEWRNRKGKRVTVQGRYIRCEGCRRPILITGVGPAMFAAREHARDCNKG